MRKLGFVILGILLCSVSVAGKKLGQAKKAKAKGHTKQAIVLKDHDHGMLAAYVLHQLKLGVRGNALSASIRIKLGEIKAARAAGKDFKLSKGPAGHKHGLEAEDLKGLGKFVATKHAEGLKGDNLSKAVTGEAKKRHEVRKKIQEQAKGGKPKGKGKK